MVEVVEGRVGWRLFRISGRWQGRDLVGMMTTKLIGTDSSSGRGSDFYRGNDGSNSSERKGEGGGGCCGVVGKGKRYKGDDGNDDAGIGDGIN